MAEPLYAFMVINGNCLPVSVTYKAGTPSVPVDLTGYGARMTVRSGSNTLVLDSPARLTLGGAAGTIVGELTSAEVKALLAGSVNSYEIRLVEPDGCLKTILKGFIDVRFSPIEG